MKISIISILDFLTLKELYIILNPYKLVEDGSQYKELVKKLMNEYDTLYSWDEETGKYTRIDDVQD